LKTPFLTKRGFLFYTFSISLVFLIPSYIYYQKSSFCVGARLFTNCRELLNAFDGHLQIAESR